VYAIQLDAERIDDKILCMGTTIGQYHSLVYILNDYLAQILTAHQFGFLPGRSDLQQLLLSAESIFNAKLTQAVDIVIMDFIKKAFDSDN